MCEKVCEAFYQQRESTGPKCEASYLDQTPYPAGGKVAGSIRIGELEAEVENLQDALNDVMDELEETQKLNRAYLTVIKNLVKDEDE